MPLRIASWSRRRVGALWGAGLLAEGVLLLPMFALLARPEPGRLLRRVSDAHATGGALVVLAPAPRSAARPPAAPEDSFYTVVHWPPGRPRVPGGGHVVGLPMRLWWVPALYVGAVPLALAGLTGAWLWARRRVAPGGPRAAV
jgi:hypothetical protein